MQRLGMLFDHEAEVEDNGVVFQGVVYSITRERWLGDAGDRARNRLEK